MAPSEPKRLLRWLGERSWLGVVRVGVAALGVGLTGWFLTSVWPEPDRVARSAPPSKNDPANLAPFPESPVTVLVIGLDSNRVGDFTNRAAPKGPANADALMLLRIAATEPVQVLQIPTELGVQLPNRDAPTSLASLWPVGGVGLLRDVIRLKIYRAYKSCRKWRIPSELLMTHHLLALNYQAADLVSRTNELDVLKSHVLRYLNQCR